MPMYISEGFSTTPHLMVLGAGGTGSWLCEYLSKLDINANVTVFDGDIVEPKNVTRQRFSDKDINQPKAFVVATDNNFAFVDDFITSADVLHEVHSDFPQGTLPIVVGCLDNNASRLIAHEFIESVDDGIWIDAGNAERHGQVYVCIKKNGQILEGFESPLTFDETLQNMTGDERRPDQISCAEQSESAPQNITANITSATTLLSVIVILLQGGVLSSNKFVFDTRTLSTIPAT